MPFDIVLRHVGGELKTVAVEHVSPNLTYVSIRWGQSGVYDLNLRDNKLTARSQKAQRKGKPHWSAQDIDAVRKAARAYLDEKRGNPHSKSKAAFKRHVENMPTFPKNNPRIVDRAPDYAPDSAFILPNGDDVRDYELKEVTPFPSYTGDPDIE